MSTARTIVSPVNLELTAVPVEMTALTKATIQPKRLAGEAPERDRCSRSAERLEALPVAPMLAVLAAVAALAWRGGFAFDLDTVNFGLLSPALALYGSVVRPLRVFTDSVANAAGILVQFPRHAGIIGFRVLVLLSSGAMMGAAVLDF